MELESLHRLEIDGLEMIVAIDSTRLGPALGGCRWRPYPDSEHARREAIALARAMTRKAALARLPLGGGKAVVSGDPKRRTRDQLLAFGDFVDSLQGRYITAADMGTGPDEMTVIAEATSHVAGLPPERGGCGDPSAYTARGVFLAIQTALARLGIPVGSAHVCVQGVGRVGRELVSALLSAGARVTVADAQPDALAGLAAEVEIVAPDRIALEACDVFAPCGPAGVINEHTVAALRCTIVCGAANNPLSKLDVGQQLADRGILYVPDFLANAGGLIHLACALEPDADREARLCVIPRNLGEVLAYAERHGTHPARAAEEIALSLSRAESVEL